MACKKDGLRYDNFYSALLYGQVAYHDFEGVTTDVAEQPRLVKSLGSKPILILRNHGLLVACPGVPLAFRTYWALQRACEIQAAADAMQGENLPVAPAVLEANPARNAAVVDGPRPCGPEFDALLRDSIVRDRNIKAICEKMGLTYEDEGNCAKLIADVDADEAEGEAAKEGSVQSDGGGNGGSGGGNGGSGSGSGGSAPQGGGSNISVMTT